MIPGALSPEGRSGACASRQGFCSSVRYSCCPGTRICRTASGA
ncbi:hypothetical protein DWX95_00565 [Butyricicoccus sp. AF22-28AC]|nr:hypothetical protein DXB94_02855 [Butyricicoccus sp. OM06-6AC]RHQ71941.1 hypothetical protein DWY17_05150 [Butyricicoccus sp. AF24-19AC]RHQ85223.1 hypothetical protein DWX95_00565 [Butyricicoccus sp. AF22-28AC]RHR89790.1 hypothetical protein DWW41_00535 [Butyricicoccus sp. AF15-40]RHS34768.1 hypothetical protein DWV55_08785 [Butyricicoccus sp. AF10-3]